MNKKTKAIVGIILFAAFLFIAYLSYNALSDKYKPSKDVQPKQEQTSQESKKIPAPDFTVLDMNGNKVKLSDFEGKPILLNFWASWCSPCKNEMPHFNEVYADVKDDVVFMMIDLVDGQRETQAKGKKHVKDKGYDFPVYFDYVDNEQQVADAYGISSIPTTLFIDSEGNIIDAYQGAIDKETLKNKISLINK